MAVFAHPPRRLRGPGIALLIVGLVFLAVGAGTRQTTFLTMGPSLAAAGIAFLAASRRRAS